MVTIFDLDIPLRDHIVSVLGEKVEVFPLYKAEDVKLPCVQIVRESAELLPSKGDGDNPLYDCQIHILCYSYDYGESVQMASTVMKRLTKVRLRYSDDDGSALIVNCMRASAGNEAVSETGAIIQEVELMCRVEVVGAKS